MSHGRGARQTALVLACVAVIAGSTGCRRSPFQRLADAADPGAALTGDRPEMPRLLPVPDEQVPPAKASVPQTVAGTAKADRAVREANAGDQEVPPPAPSMPTPLLDAALKRALATEQLERQVFRAEAAESPTLAAATVSRPPLPDKAKAAPPPAAPDPPKEDRAAGEMAAGEDKGAEDLMAAPPALDPVPDEPPDLAPSWEESVGKLKKLAQDTASQSPSDKGAALWRVRAQVMDWMASETSESANENLLKKAVMTIADAMKTKAEDASARSAEIRSTVQELEERVPLALTNLRVCRNVLGFGSFEPLDTSSLKPGQPVILYCELAGLRYRSSGQSFVSRLSSRVELIGARDGATVWVQPLGEAEYECRSRRRDNYVNFRINVPPNLKPGDYRLRLTETDMVACQTATSELAVTITR